MRYTMLVPMGRPRTKDFDLPPRMRRKGKALYYDHGNGHWTPLGSDLCRAKRRWADLEYVPVERSVADLVDRYLDECCNDLSPSSKRQYGAVANIVRREWGEQSCATFRTSQIAQWRDRKGTSKTMANTVISVLRSAYRKGVEWEWSESNPALSACFNAKHERGRYMTDAEFVAIRDAAPTWMRTAMNLAYLTGLRPCDVVSLRWDQVAERVTLLPSKTKKSRIAISYEITPELRAVLDEARRRPIVGLFVAATEKGRPIRARRLQERFAVIVRKLGIVDCQFRDIRSKAATDADADGQDAQALLHHTSPRMTARYLKNMRVKKTQPLRRKL